MTEQQEAPFTLKIELTYGCNLRCSFCGMNGIKDARRTYDYMEPDTMLQLMDLVVAAGWNPRVEMAMRGEPSLHPQRDNMIGIIRKRLPGASIMMTSNGGGWVHKDPGVIIRRILSAFDAGLNVLLLDDYEDANIVPRIRHALEWYGGELPMANVWAYPEQPEGNPHRRRRPNVHDLVFMDDLTTTSKGTHNRNRMNNHCGAAAPLDYTVHKRCAHPFRELAVRYDGEVALCCNDWRGAMKLVNIHDIEDVRYAWDHPAMTAIRRMLYAGKRVAGPCKGCTAVSYRTGLLPDKKGQVTLPVVSPKDLATVHRACAGPSLVLPVLRPWEAPELVVV